MATPRDRQILNSLVNPNLPLGEGVFDEENQLPEDLKDNLNPSNISPELLK